LSDTWELPSQSDVKPALFVTINWREANSRASGLEAIHVRADAGGRGYARGQPEEIDGANLYIWNAVSGSSKEIASNEAPPDAPERLLFDAFDTEDPEKYVVARDDTIGIALTTKGWNGYDNTAEVSLDYLDVTFEYR